MFYLKNNLWLGLALGFFFPFVAYALVLTFYEYLEDSGIIHAQGMATAFRERTSAIIALCVNLLVVNYYNKQKLFDTMKGIVIMTVVLAFVWFFYFGIQLL